MEAGSVLLDKLQLLQKLQQAEQLLNSQCDLVDGEPAACTPRTAAVATEALPLCCHWKPAHLCKHAVSQRPDRTKAESML